MRLCSISAIISSIAFWLRNEEDKVRVTGFSLGYSLPALKMIL